MSEQTIEFVQRLVEAFPALEEDYEIHVFNNAGETLPYVFVSMELMDAVVGAFTGEEEYRELDWAAVLDYLDKQLAEADREVREVIVTSFVLDLPFPGQPGYGLVDHLGPHLAQSFAANRPAG
jgi:hypothetical protein